MDDDDNGGNHSQSESKSNENNHWMDPDEVANTWEDPIQNNQGNQEEID